MRCHYIDELISRRPRLNICKQGIEVVCSLLINSYKNGGKVLVCGNGGSASDSAHIVGELMKGFLKRRELSAREKMQLAAFGAEGNELADHLQGALGAIDLTVFHALSTAIANDMKADYTYAQALLGLGKPNDVFVGISTSGNAKNVHFAAIVAKERGLILVGLSGQDGGKMCASGLYDVVVQVPERETYKIQEEHIAIYHTICMTVEENLYE